MLGHKITSQKYQLCFCIVVVTKHLENYSMSDAVRCLLHLLSGHWYLLATLKSKISGNKWHLPMGQWFKSTSSKDLSNWDLDLMLASVPSSALKSCIHKYGHSQIHFSLLDSRHQSLIVGACYFFSCLMEMLYFTVLIYAFNEVLFF